MKSLFLLFTAALFLVAAPALAQIIPPGCPNPGYYTTITPVPVPGAKPMLPGRATEAYCGAAPQGGQPGNTLVAESWDGAGGLGIQWTVFPMVLDNAGAQLTGGDGVNTVEYTTTYNNDVPGANFTLAGNHIWANGSPGVGMSGPVTNFVVVATFDLNTGAVSSVITFDGTFPNCTFPGQNCTLSATALANRVGTGPLLPSYPPLWCGTAGEYFDVYEVTMVIDCPVPSTDVTWGAMKGLYR